MFKGKRALLWSLILLLNVLLLACDATPESTTPATNEINWETQRTDAFTFEYPENWNVLPLPDVPGEAYAIFLPGQAEGSNILVLLLLEEAAQVNDLEELEAFTKEEIVESQNVVSSEIVETVETEVAGLEAYRIRYRMEREGGLHVEGVQVGSILPDGRVLTFTMSTFSEEEFEQMEPVLNHVVESVSLL